MASTSVDAQLDVIPDSVIEFVLSEKEASPKVTMTLRHSDPKSEPIAFKVKTTQPRRYLVRPNQGVIQPGSFEHVQILLVEKDKTSLLQSYQRLGQSALDQSKDKFLVQSITVDTVRAKNLQDYEKLTALWTSVTSAGSNVTVTNKKLSVKLTADVQSGSTSGSSGLGPGTSSTTDPSMLSQEQLVSELSGLRRKYDELVAFSVNLTAERDILNNTLEQTKRDLNRQIAKSAANDNTNIAKQKMTRRNGYDESSPKHARSIVRLVLHIFVIIAALFVGAYFQYIGFLDELPVVGKNLFPSLHELVRSISNHEETKTTSETEVYREEL